MKKAILIDGNSLINRAFYALPDMTDENGIHTNAVYGFANILSKVLREGSPDYMAVAFDLKAKTFRHKMFDGYKATRKGMAPELAEQMPLLKEMLELIGIPKLELEGYEADDIIGTMSKYCEENGLKTTIITGDRDAFQLASNNTSVLYTKKGVSEFDIVDENYMIENYGVTPTEYIDVKALMGDSSDNIPGVKGVGEKTAFKLITEYKNIETLYEKIDEQKGALRKKLEDGKDDAFLSKTLATIIRDIPAEISKEDIVFKEKDLSGLREFFLRHNMMSLVKKLEDENSSNPEIIDNSDIKIEFEQDNSKLLDIEKGELFLKVIRVESPVNLKKILSIIVYFEEKFFKIPEDEILKFKEIFENNEIKKSGYDLKSDILALFPYEIQLNGINFDLKIADYIIDPESSNHDIRDIAIKNNLGSIKSDEDFFGKGAKRRPISKLIESDTAEYYGQILYMVSKAEDYLSKKITDMDMEYLFNEVEMPLVEVLASMEYTGFKADKNQLETIKEEFVKIISELEQKIYDEAGEEFNINSPKQLGYILFEKMNLPVIKKTKTGYSTDASVLEKLLPYGNIAELVMSYRTYTKLQSTYVEGLLVLINKDTDRIHSSFNQTVASTGRLSSTEPNLQNIPVRDEIGRNLRKVFVAENNYFLVDADYSQIELRVLAHISGDKNLISAFSKEADIHTFTASEVFSVPIDEVTKAQRSAAKAVNFGIVYGISDFGLSNNLGITKKQAGEYIEMYLARYPEVSKYMDDVIKEGEEKGYVSTIINRRRYVPQLKSNNFIQKNLGKRLAMNAPIQGSAADIIKIAMVKVYNRLKEGGYKSRLILQVHDELMIEAAAGEEKEMEQILREEMANVLDLKVKLEVDINTGKSWFDTK